MSRALAIDESVIPTYEEFEQKVKEMVYEDLQRCADKDKLKEYLESDTANDEIKDRYTKAVRDYKNGRLRDIAWGGKEDSVAYCLYMMYEE